VVAIAIAEEAEMQSIVVLELLMVKDRSTNRLLVMTISFVIAINTDSIRAAMVVVVATQLQYYYS